MGAKRNQNRPLQVNDVESASTSSTSLPQSASTSSTSATQEEVLNGLLEPRMAQLQSENSKYIRLIAMDYAKKQSQKAVKELELKLTDQINTANEKIGAKIELSRNAALQTLGLFVALFTFVSVNITLFSKIDYLSSGLWFMLLMATILIIFVLALNMMIHTRDMSLTKTIINWIMITGLFLGIGYFLYLTQRNDRLNPLIKNSELNPSAQKASNQESAISSPGNYSQMAGK